MKCPKCGLDHPEPAQRCDCGYDFDREQGTSVEAAFPSAMTESPAAGSSPTSSSQTADREPRRPLGVTILAIGTILISCLYLFIVWLIVSFNQGSGQTVFACWWVLHVMAGWGLWKLRNWARWIEITIITMAFIVEGALWIPSPRPSERGVGLALSIFGVLLVWYLSSRKVRQVFKHSKSTSSLKLAGLITVTVVVGFSVLVFLLPSCIVEGTPIDTPSGSCKIEDLRVGDEVWTRAPSGELQVGRVRAVHSAWSMAQRMIVLPDGRTLNTTAQHPVATETGWKLAGQLEVGESVWSREGWRTIAALTNTDSLVRVFDLEVEPNPNFFANGVLVHNKIGPAFPWESRGDYASEASAISSVRNIVTSQISYSSTAGEGSYATSLTDLENAKLIDSVLGSGTKDGFTFSTTASSDGTTFTVTATALSQDKTFPRNFYSDETGVIRYTIENRPAWFKDPPLGQ